MPSSSSRVSWLVPLLAVPCASTTKSTSLSKPPKPERKREKAMFKCQPHPSKSRQLFGSIRQVAIHLNVSTITIRRRIRKGELPATRIGGQIRISWVEVDNLIAHGSIGSSL